MNQRKLTALDARRGSGGFTLIELMMAILVGSIVLTGMFAFSSIQQGTANLHHRSVRINQALEGAMWTMGRDIRSSGLGFARVCSELRVWSPDANSGAGALINPGAPDDNGSLASDVVLDPTTSEPYWVLRDGLQAHWRSSADNSDSLAVNLGDISGGAVTSASFESAADSFDVILGERNFTAGSGIFRSVTVPTASDPNAVIIGESNAAVLSSADASALAWVRQLMPPGSFLAVARDNLQPASTYQTYEAQAQGQCALLQVTGPIEAGAADGQWQIPVGSVSGFNANLGELLGPGTQPVYGSTDPVRGVDWDPSGADSPTTARMIVPLGRLRWSRYEIDFTAPTVPYLVRTDLIGFNADTDPTSTGSVGVGVPGCQTGSNCPLAQLHIPGVGAAGNVVNLPRIAVGPMIEDLQIAVGCDGWSATSPQVTNGLVQPPDNFSTDYGERGETMGGPTNTRVDEWLNDRGNDEWLGNAVNEQWAPDCVYYGSGEFRASTWESSGPPSEQRTGPGFRMSPQTVRVTIAGKSRQLSTFDGAPTVLFPIEDRPEVDSTVPGREYYTVSESFTPPNLRWRNPSM
jgi:prepilin-type N-terminal cleavage/methylation domain-containing protein